MTATSASGFAVAPWPPREPDDIDVAGVAWRSRYEVRPEDPPDWRGSVARWTVTTALGQILIMVVHLRPIEGVKPAHLLLEGATHELLMAVPESFVHDPDVVVKVGALIATVQVNQGDDAAAQKLAHYVVHRLIAHGDHPLGVAMMLARGVKPACSGAAS